MKKNGRIKNYGFTLIEMLVVIAIMAILSALLMPSLRKAIGMANQVSCANNQKQLAVAYLDYSNDYNGFLPPAYIDHGNGTKTFWRRVLAPYVGLEGISPGVWCFMVTVFTCPTAHSLHSGRTDGYAQNGASTTIMQKPKTSFPKQPAKMIMMSDGRWRSSGGFWENVVTRTLLPDFIHSNHVNVLYYDLHVSTVHEVNFPANTITNEGRAFWYGVR